MGTSTKVTVSSSRSVDLTASESGARPTTTKSIFDLAKSGSGARPTNLVAISGSDPRLTTTTPGPTSQFVANPGASAGAATGSEDAAFIAAGCTMVRNVSDNELYQIGNKYVHKNILCKMSTEKVREEICGYLVSKDEVLEMVEYAKFQKRVIWDYLFERSCKAVIAGQRRRLPRCDQVEKREWISALKQHLAGETNLKFEPLKFR